MGRIDITRGQLLDMKWLLPIEAETGEQVDLGTESESLVFERDGQVLGFFTTHTTDALNFITQDGSEWFLSYQTMNTNFLPYGENTYMFSVYDRDGNVMVEDEGIVCIHHG